MFKTTGSPPLAQPTSLSRARLREALDLCVRKTRRNIQRLADDPVPSSWAFDKEGQYWRQDEGFFEISNWTTSFFTGMALLAWKHTREEFFLEQVKRLAPLYRAKVCEHDRDTMHDLGFLYSLYSVALFRLTGDPGHRETGLRAAEVLARRADPRGGYIRAWGRMDETDTDYAGLAIIDCLMNLPLLYWASKESGDPKFHQAAMRHADVTLKHFVRADDTVCHAYRFDPRTGQPCGADNYCGRAVESQWARGTAWAIYGFALSHRHTRDPRYLDASLRLARKFVASLDPEGVPVWDFRLPAAEPRRRDSSGAAIAVCGLQELLAQQPAAAELRGAKQRLLDRLCSADYFDADEDCPGLLKQGQVGDGVGKARTAYTSWGDYYFMEAVARELGIELGCW